MRGILESTSGKRHIMEREHTSFPRFDAADSTVSIATSSAEIRDAKLQEKIAFVQAIARRQDVIFGDSVAYSTKSKEEAWKAVAKEMEELGLRSYAGKTWTRLRDHDWQYVRRHALARCENNHKPSGKLGDLDRLVLAIVNNFHSRFFAEHSIEQPMSDTAYDDLDLVNKSTEMKRETDCSVERNVMSSCYDAPLYSQVAGYSSDQTSSNQSVDCNDTNGSYSQCSKMEGNEFCLSLPRREIRSDSPLSSPLDRDSRTHAHSSVRTLPDASDKTDAVHHPSAKRPRRTELISVFDGNISDDTDFLRRKQQLELRKMELENEKLEKEIQYLTNQEKRARELHSIELRRARFQLVMMGADLLQEPRRDE